jgi:hypothetical protein
MDSIIKADGRLPKNFRSSVKAMRCHLSHKKDMYAFIIKVQIPNNIKSGSEPSSNWLGGRCGHAPNHPGSSPLGLNLGAKFLNEKTLSSS